MNTNEFEEFKNILTNRRQKIQENILGLKEDLGGLHNNDVNDDADFATINTDSLIGETLSQKLVQEIEEIDYVLNKIDNQTYGICEMCEEEIEKERLKVKPHARYCVECREIVEKMTPVISSNKTNMLYK